MEKMTDSYFKMVHAYGFDFEQVASTLLLLLVLVAVIKYYLPFTA